MAHEEQPLMVFKCDMRDCGAIFFGEPDKTSHMRREHGLVMKCPYALCTEFFYEKEGIREHVRVVHWGKKSRFLIEAQISEILQRQAIGK